MNDPIKILHFFTRVRKIKWEKIPRNVPLGKIFWDWMETTDYPPEGYKFNSINLLTDAPIPYEVSYGLSNWADCADWLRENFITADTRFPLTYKKSFDKVMV